VDKKKASRMKRALKTRMNILNKRTARLSIYRSPRHIYAQIISGGGDKTLAAASTLDGSFEGSSEHKGNVIAAAKVGKLIAERAIDAGVKQVAFDRSGYRYHGRVKALAEAARSAGLVF
tara:strand:- start:141 stop:497 length:357 start_codon:yes stop_codon:yes gene_type:complete